MQDLFLLLLRNPIHSETVTWARLWHVRCAEENSNRRTFEIPVIFSRVRKSVKYVSQKTIRTNRPHQIVEASLLMKQFRKQDANRVTIRDPTMHKRNRAVQLLLLPPVLFMWIVGWSLYWIGSNKKPTKPTKTPEKLTHYVLMPEEKLVTQ